MSDISETLRTLLFDDMPPNHLEEVAKLKQYLNDGSPHGEPLFLSLGETWEHTPKPLRESLGRAPLYTHGYQLSMYGLPEFRQVAAQYIEISHGLASIAKPGIDYQVAASWTGTRNAMYDFGRLLQAEYFKDTAAEIITTAPGWDYPGVFSSLGYDVRYVQLKKEYSFRPDVADFELIMGEPAKNNKSLLVINAQHNPTSINWPEETVHALIKRAMERSFAILIDDAHFGVCHPDVKPTSSLRILLEELQRYPDYNAPWLAVRSLGKQFGINGWGIGMLTASPETLDRFVNTYRVQHIYNYGGMLQYSLAEWLKKGTYSSFLASRSEEILHNKQMIQDRFTQKFGYSDHDVFLGDCTNFVLFAVPEYFAQQANGVKLFLHECLRFGIVLTDAWPKPYDTAADTIHEFNCIRVFAGASAQTIQAFLDRFEARGFHFAMKRFS
jgi:N-succinyldiaminopimelate aminotransferase